MPRRVSLVSAFILAVVFGSPAGGSQFSDWGAPSNLGSVLNTSFAEFHSCMTKDGLSLYFTSTRAGGYGGWDIYVSQRADVGDPWATPQNLGPTINTSANEGAPVISIDGHRMIFQSDAAGGFGLNDLYVSRRQDKRDVFGWQASENLGPGINTEWNEVTPTVFEDDASGVLSLYFASDQPGGPGGSTANAQGNDLWVSTKAPWDDAFRVATLVPELNSTFADRGPYISRDGLEMYITSDRPGTYGGLDLWVATRSTAADPWSTPINLSPVVNSAAADARAVLSFDGRTLFFQSARPGTLGSYDLYATERTAVQGRQ